MSKKKMKLTTAHYVGGAVALGLGFYAYRNRDELRLKVAALIGKEKIAVAARPAIAPAAPAVIAGGKVVSIAALKA